MKKSLTSIKTLLSGFQALAYLVFFIALSSAYLYYITKNALVSIITGVITSLFIFRYTVVLAKEKAREIYYLKELQKYTTNMTFYLQSGYNILNSLELSKERLDKEIQKDIDKIIDTLTKEAKLDTDHFKKYHFSSINLFHKQLEIMYEAGGNPRELFDKVNQNINFEIVKRDELFRKKAALKNQVLLMMVMVLSIPLFLAFSSKQLYNMFLSTGALPIATNIILFVLLIINLIIVQKSANDTSIHF